jgi:uncharacterized membrane protein YphA (DoxX/SURF4 family)
MIAIANTPSNFSVKHQHQQQNKTMNTNTTNKTSRETRPQKSPSKAKNIILWILQVLVAFAFLGAGFGKLSSQPMMVEMFDKLGLGQWFRYLTGIIELGSAIMLLVPRITFVGAALLVCTMTGAVAAHLFKLGGSPVPPLVLLTFSSVIAWGRFDGFKKSFFNPAPPEKAPVPAQSDETLEA